MSQLSPPDAKSQAVQPWTFRACIQTLPPEEHKEGEVQVEIRKGQAALLSAGQ